MKTQTYQINWSGTFFLEGKEHTALVVADSLEHARKEFHKLTQFDAFNLKFVPEKAEHFKLLEQVGRDYVVTQKPN